MQNKTIQAILEHAYQQFPKEACGLLLDTGYGVEVLRCENISHQPEQEFLIDPLVYAQQAERISAVYHSHPNRSPEPSEADIYSAERCNVPFLIVGLPSEEIYTYTPKGIKPAYYEGRHFCYGVVDCLSLVVDYYRNELAIEIDDGQRKRWNWWLDSAYLNDFIDGFKRQGFKAVDELQKNDVIIMQLGGGPCPNHAAIYQGANLILHHPSAETDSRVEVYGQYWRQSTVCYLRHPNGTQKL